MMRIAAASEGKNLTEHFGNCVNFNIYDVEDGRIINEESIPNPGHKPGFLPNFLGEQGINVIINGGIGAGAVEIFKERNIEVISGASGDSKTAVENYLKGELKTTGFICHKHQNHNECGK